MRVVIMVETNRFGPTKAWAVCMQDYTGRREQQGQPRYNCFEADLDWGRYAETLTKKLLTGILKPGRPPCGWRLTRLRLAVKPQTLLLVRAHRANSIQKVPSFIDSPNVVLLESEQRAPEGLSQGAGQDYLASLTINSTMLRPQYSVRAGGSEGTEIDGTCLDVARTDSAMELMRSQAQKGDA